MAGLKNSSRSFLMARHTPPMSVPRHHADGRGTSDHGKECLTYLVIIFKKENTPFQYVFRTFQSSTIYS